MTYDEALSFWYGRINYEVRAAKPGDLKLERMRALLQILGNPHDRVRLVHVTGTKGKGSTCAMLASTLRAAGYRVGLFTSPHLEHVEERIQVDGPSISSAELAACMDEVAPAVRQLDDEAEDGRGERDHLPRLTFFEIGTALGFLHFCRRRCDVAVIEVGLGGRFDSTNVCNPLVSVVTSVGFDHVAQLGNTLEAIAYQKAGIIKRGIPVVSGVTQDGAREVIRTVAAEMNAPLWEIGTDFRYECWPNRDGSAIAVRTPRAEIRADLRLPGTHQAANAALAVAAVERLRDAGMAIPHPVVATGLRDVSWPARIETIARQPWIILDTAHNVPSAEALVKTLEGWFPIGAGGRKSLVFAVSSDKQYPEMLRILAGYFDHFHLTKYGVNPRCVPPEKLATVLAEVAAGTSFTVHQTSREAWSAARSSAGENDLVCITGSVFLAGELRPVLIG